MIRTRQKGGTDEVQLIYITWQKSEKNFRGQRRERCLSTLMSLPTNTPQLPSCSALPLTPLLLFLFQVNVELMHCLFPPQDSVWGVLLTQFIFICRHLNQRVMGVKGACGRSYERMFYTKKNFSTMFSYCLLVHVYKSRAATTNNRKIEN